MPSRAQGWKVITGNFLSIPTLNFGALFFAVHIMSALPRGSPRRIRTRGLFVLNERLVSDWEVGKIFETQTFFSGTYSRKSGQIWNAIAINKQRVVPHNKQEHIASWKFEGNYHNALRIFHSHQFTASGHNAFRGYLARSSAHSTQPGTTKIFSRGLQNGQSWFKRGNLAVAIGLLHPKRPSKI